MSTLTPEQFMTMPEPEEDDFQPFEVGVLNEWSEVPRQSGKNMSWVIESLQRIEARLDTSGDDGLVREISQELSDLEDKHATLYALLEEIEGIIKPSVGKLAIRVRKAITAWRAPEVPVEAEPEPSDQPAHDADVEEWRLYARSRGYTVGEMNRSQIRTMLGIAQPEPSDG